jgi:hypothetical protein
MKSVHLPPAARTGRAAAVVLATVGLAVLTACASSSPGGTPVAGGHASSPSTNAEKAVAFSRCVRSHGVPAYPDPDSSGTIRKETSGQLGVSTSRLQAALDACQHLLPNTGNVDDNPAALQQWWTQMLDFARCMHARGVPNWPDPSPYPLDTARPTFNLHAAGIAFHQGSQPGNIVNSATIQAKVQACEAATHQNVSGYYE